VAMFRHTLARTRTIAQRQRRFITIASEQTEPLVARHAWKLFGGATLVGSIAYFSPVGARTATSTFGGSSSSSAPALVPVDKPNQEWIIPSTWELILRSVKLCYIFLPILIASPLYLFHNEGIDRWLNERLRCSLEQAGPVFIKLGQWASTRYDLIPLALCDELNKLTQNAPSHSWEITEETLREEFKGDYGRSLKIIPKLIASGSVAQIYEGHLGDEHVAIKVQHPNIAEIMAKDLELMNKLLYKCDQTFNTNIIDIFEQFSDQLAEQLDFRLEKQNLEKFQKNFRYWDFVKFPQPHVATEKVLVESFEEGHSIIDYIKAKGDASATKNGMVDKSAQEKLASIGLSALLKMIMNDGFIHADLHPGNILVRKLEPSSNPFVNLKQKIEAKLLGFDFADGGDVPQCIFLDAGLATAIDHEKKPVVESFFKSIITYNGEELAKSILEFSPENGCNSKEARENFKETMAARTNRESDDCWDFSLRTGECMKDALEIIRRYQIRLDTQIMVPFICAITLEGWQYELDPTVSVLDHIQKQVYRGEYMVNLANKCAHAMWRASEENLGLYETSPPSVGLQQDYAVATGQP